MKGKLYLDTIYFELSCTQIKKELVVFVHPLGMDNSVWTETVEALKTDFDVLTIDLPGHGQSQHNSEKLNISILNLAIMVKDLVLSLGYDKFFYVGTSIGGAIGQELLLSYPDSLKGLMVTNTSHKIGSEEFWQDRAIKVRNEGLKEVGKNIVLRWFSEDYINNNPEIIQKWQLSFANLNNEVYAQLCEALGEWSSTDRLQDASSIVPVICVAGDDDPAMSLEKMQDLANLMNTSLEVMQLGHVPSVEKPQEFNTLLSSWLKGQIA